MGKSYKVVIVTYKSLLNGIMSKVLSATIKLISTNYCLPLCNIKNYIVR